MFCTIIIRARTNRFTGEVKGLKLMFNTIFSQNSWLCLVKTTYKILDIPLVNIMSSRAESSCGFFAHRQFFSLSTCPFVRSSVFL